MSKPTLKIGNRKSSFKRRQAAKIIREVMTKKEKVWGHVRQEGYLIPDLHFEV